MKPIRNFNDHPDLKDDPVEYIFLLDEKIYLLTEEEVKQILPVRLAYTNLGDPYRELARLYYGLRDRIGSIDIHFEDVAKLRAMCKLADIEVFVSEELGRHAKRLEELFSDDEEEI